MSDKDSFTFIMSLSILDHLGRRLYRSFATVLGEAISNSWDANADNVWIYIDKQKNSFVIKDDGDGMTWSDFQYKFLKIGYTKRKHGETHSPGKNRPYVGRKGIGKLALLSCANKIAIISKTMDGKYVGGVIDNPELDKAITDDLNPQQYPLAHVVWDDFDEYMKGHKKGTIIYFMNMKEGIKSSLDNIRKILALFFRFSLIDKSFKIFVDDKPITFDDLDDLARRTEFLWIINDLSDPYTIEKLKYDKTNRKKDVNLLEPGKKIDIEGNFKGFIASVRKPADLKIFGTDERVSVDLFVNGRLRERGILKHIPTTKVPENYLYGQIHLNDLDDGKDRFSTSREGIVADDDKFKQLLDSLSKIIARVIADWDPLRRKYHREGDPENTSITKKERKAEELYNVVSDEYKIAEDTGKPELSEKVDRWVDDLSKDAAYNFSSYADCFISENLIRKHIEDKNVPLSKKAIERIDDIKRREKSNKDKGNISIELRKTPIDTSYLAMDDLANVVDKTKDPMKEAGLSRDASEYKPIRDALMHTALLTPEAKARLTTVFRNITSRVRTLLSKE
jgi:hypothetical protein